MMSQNSLNNAYGGDKNKRVKNDYYPTPPVATFALAKTIKLPERLWEPAAGRGHMVNELRRLGHNVIGSDLNSYEDPLVFDIQVEVDFLGSYGSIGGRGIVTNPPYKLAKEFAERALLLSNFVAVLCSVLFIESKSRKELFNKYPLTWVLPFSDRVNFLDWEKSGKELGGMMCHAWFVWDYRTPNEGRDSRVRIIDTRAMLERRRVDLEVSKILEKREVEG